MPFHEEIARELVIGIVVSLVLGLAAYFSRKRLRHPGRRALYSLTNKRIPISLKLVRKYKGPILKPLSHAVFKLLQSKVTGTDKLSLDSVSPEALHVNSETLSLGVSVEFAPEYDITTLDAESPKVLNYKMVIWPRTSFRWGRRDVEDLRHLCLLMDKIPEATEALCLQPGETPVEEFLLVDYRQDNPPLQYGPDELRDSKLNVGLTVNGLTVHAVLPGTRQLVTFAKRNIPR